MTIVSFSPDIFILLSYDEFPPRAIYSIKRIELIFINNEYI